jgi:hypothetical protein
LQKFIFAQQSSKHLIFWLLKGYISIGAIIRTSTLRTQHVSKPDTPFAPGQITP